MVALQIIVIKNMRPLTEEETKMMKEVMTPVWMRDQMNLISKKESTEMHKKLEKHRV